MITNKELVAFVKKAADEKWGYVFGGQGEMYTKELAEQWGNAHRAGMDYDYFVNDCAHWFGHTVVDCSGLIVQAYRSKDPAFTDRTANRFRLQFVESAPIGTIPDIPGLACWRDGHIGIYIGNGKVVEAAGYKYGVVYSDVGRTANGGVWKDWGKLPDVEYITAFVLTRNLRYRLPMMKGDDVKELQTVLKSLHFDCGSIDGVFGKNTKKAVMAFQKSKRLQPDGVVGAKTANALGWEYQK